jgi:predicted enzyme related to lactoylglutathione lyase
MMKTEFDSYEPGRPCWVDVMTTDADAAKTFYGQVFGWDAEDNLDDEGNRIYVTFSKGGRSTAGMGEMGPEQRASGMPPVWSTYIATDDADKVGARIPELGGTVVMPPMDVMTAGRMLVAQDPTGAFISFWQPRDHPGAQLANTVGSFGWNELQTRDTAAAERFYTELVGWTAKTSEGDMPYTEFKLDGESVAAMMPMPPMVPAEVPANWLTYFGVDDCDASVATIEAAGGSVLQPPTDVPVGRFSAVTDPQGAVFAVIALSGEGLG